jgi:CheY-like chemotaxis protein
MPLESRNIFHQRALVVDDEKWVREFIREVLEQEGFEVWEAEDGKSAALLLREKGNFDLLVTDILMPEEDGIELIRETKRLTRSHYPLPKVIAISGGGIFARPELFLNIAHNLGADLSLAKPFTDENLREALLIVGLKAGRTGAVN